jgi:hypothetical protein
LAGNWVTVKDKKGDVVKDKNGNPVYVIARTLVHNNRHAFDMTYTGQITIYHPDLLPSAWVDKPVKGQDHWTGSYRFTIDNNSGVAKTIQIVQRDSVTGQESPPATLTLTTGTDPKTKVTSYNYYPVSEPVAQPSNVIVLRMAGAKPGPNDVVVEDGAGYEIVGNTIRKVKPC